MRTYPGIYAASVVGITSNVLTVRIPEVFANAPVEVVDFAGTKPTTPSTGWIMFESGNAAYPVWMGTQSPITDPAPAPGGTGGHTIQDEGAALPARAALNFTGSGVVATDDAANNRTSVTITGGGTGGGDNEVWIGPSDPIGANPTIELWIDTDAVVSAGVSTYTHVQSTPAATWVIVHNLGFNPSVNVVDSADSEVEGEITYNNVNQATVRFSAAFSGKAYLS